jgi:glutathione S-transferase
MILIGQYDSPFVRRVGIALRLYELTYRHEPWSVWTHADKIASLNPLTRVPTLQLDDGEILIESSAILDALDEMVPRERVLLPRNGPVRRHGLRVCAFATGMADKAVSLFYERLLRSAPSEHWMTRCRNQIERTLDVLESDRASEFDWWLGPRLGHADIAVACALRFIREAHPNVFDERRWPKLAAHSRACEARPEFRDISQPLQVAMQ